VKIWHQVITFFLLFVVGLLFVGVSSEGSSSPSPSAVSSSGSRSAEISAEEAKAAAPSGELAMFVSTKGGQEWMGCENLQGILTKFSQGGPGRIHHLHPAPLLTS
jgi:hypothetical protein